MNNSRLRPKVVLWWGIILTVVGALLVVFLPDIGYAIVQYGNGKGSAGVQSIMVGFNTVVRVIGVIIPPLGAALIGASAVMAYVRHILDPMPGATDAELTNKELPRSESL